MGGWGARGVGSWADEYGAHSQQLGCDEQLHVTVHKNRLGRLTLRLPERRPAVERRIG